MFGEPTSWPRRPAHEGLRLRWFLLRQTTKEGKRADRAVDERRALPVAAALQEYLLARLSPQKSGYGAEVVEVGAMKDSKERFLSPGPFHGLRGCFHHAELRGRWTSLLLCGGLAARVGL